MRGVIIFSFIKNPRLNLTALILIFLLLLFFIHQYNLSHQVFGLYFGNTIVINSGNVSSSFTKGQISSVEGEYAYAVWVDKNNTIYFSATHENGTTFSSPIALSANNTLAISPQIDATEKGGVYVVWVDKNNDTGDSNIVFRGSNDNGKSFDRSVRLNRNVAPNQTATASYPQIDATEKGGVYVVWVDKKENGDTNIAFITSNNSGNDFTNRKYIRSNDLLSFSPKLDATEKGGVYVVWVDKNNDTGDSNIVFRGSNDNGKSFDRSVRLNRNPNQTSLSFSPQIAANEMGSVFVTWPENTLQFKELLEGGTISGRTISLNNHVVLPLSAQIVATEKGNIYLAWAEKNNGLNNDTVLMFKRISQYYFDRR